MGDDEWRSHRSVCRRRSRRCRRSRLRRCSHRSRCPRSRHTVVPVVVVLVVFWDPLGVMEEQFGGLLGPGDLLGGLWGRSWGGLGGS